MTRRHRLLLLPVVPLAVGLAWLAVPGRAQPAATGRYAFSDTTLLRDTLGLSFQGLFPLADSLAMPPDSLRAISVRYRYTLARLVKLADSLGMPVDSVGPVMLVERFNPLATSSKRTNTLQYNSSYDIAQTSSTWTNTSDYSFVLGSAFVRNSTNITMDRSRYSTSTSLRQARSSTTEGGWKFSPQFSVGGRANLERYDSANPGSVLGDHETKNEFQLSVRSRQQPLRGLTSDLNLFTGLLDDDKTTELKRGLTGDVNGRLRYVRGNWFTHDLSGQVTGNLARTRAPDALEPLNSRDLSNNLRGALGLFASAPAAFNLNYSLRTSRVQTPGLTGGIQSVRSDNTGLDMSLRLRRDNDRTLSLQQRFASTRQASPQALRSQSTRNDGGFNASGRYGFRTWIMEGSFNRNESITRFPRRDTTGGYREDNVTRAVDATLTWNASQKLVAKINGNVSLTSSRYGVIGRYRNVPPSRDQYQQSYRVDGQYTLNENLNSGAALEVRRSLYINIPSANTGDNNETRSYRGEWRWSYRLLSGLTVTQRNQLTADYTYYSFNPQNKNRLSLLYSTLTTLNAVVTPRLALDITHSSRFQPSGKYTVFPDGLSYFARSDDSKSLSLVAHMAYTPTPAISFTVAPEYVAGNRNGTLNGASVPQRDDRSLNLSGGASLNVPFAGRGHLTGSINRSYRASRTISFKDGVPLPTPSDSREFWNGSLQLSWQL